VNENKLNTVRDICELINPKYITSRKINQN